MAELDSIHSGEHVKLHHVLRDVARDFFHAQKEDYDDGEVVDNHGSRSLTFFHRTRDSFRERSPQLKEAVRHTSAEILQWMHKGGAWRALLITTVGVVLLLGLAGLSACMLFFLVATLNAIVIALLGTVASVGAFTFFFFSSLIVIYIWAVIAAVISISTITVLCVCGAVTVAGWIGFFWLVWQGLKKGVDICKASCFMPLTTFTRVVSRDSGSYEKVGY